MKKILLKFCLITSISLLLVTSTLAEDKPKKQPTRYVPLNPPMVVNVDDKGSTRFLQVTTQVSVNTPNAEGELETHMAPIRHEMVMLLSGQKVAEITTLKGKEKLRKKSLAAIQKVLKENTGKPVVNAVFFTGFIIQ